MRYLRVLAVVGICLFSASYAHAQRVVVGFGFGPTYVDSAPVCTYGYYGYYPYECAPYGYYGPEWFSDGFFIGAGPWYGRYGGYYGRGFRDFDDRRHDYYGRGGFRGDFGRGGYGREGFRGERGRGGDSRERGFRGGERGFHGGESHGGGFRGEAGLHGGGGFRGGS